MKLWACAYQYEEDYFWDFQKNDNTYDIESTQLLPTKELAEQMIEEILCDDYVAVQIVIYSYKENGIMSYTVGRVDRWASDNECKDED